MKKAIFAMLAVAGAATTANAADLLLVDLTVPNQLTISATTGLASASASTSDFNGFLLSGFYNGNQSVALGVVAGAGNFTTFNNPADNSPSSFRGTNDPGLNIWDFSSAGTITTTNGVQAFTGSATYNLSAGQYADMLAGNLTGDIFFGADTSDDIGGAGVTLIGQWRVIPTPGAMAAFGLAGLAAARRRR